MCTDATAEKILNLVKAMPEVQAQTVLHFAESLLLLPPEEEDQLLEEVIAALPQVEAFRGDPLKLQEALRSESLQT